MPSKRLLFVNRFYAPDNSATAQILTDVAESFASSEFEVRVITSRASYEGQHAYRSQECLRGVRVKRVVTTQFGRSTTFGRMLDYLTFYCSSCLSVFVSIKPGDIIVAKTDPPMLSVPLGFVARFRGAKLVNWLQDIFPETAAELGVGSREGRFFKALKIIRNHSLRHAKLNIAIGHRMAKKIESFGVHPDKIRVIENFSDDKHIQASLRHSEKLRDEWGIGRTDFVIGYSGNLGRAHDLDTIINAADQLRAHARIKFLFIGGGHLHQRLKKETEARSLTNILVRPYQPRERLNSTLALPNLHWVSLVPELEGLIVPSKIYGIAAAGRPVLMIGDQSGEVGRLLQEYEFGKCVEPGCVEDARDFILRLAQTPSLGIEYGARARNLTDERASKQLAIDLWQRTICSVGRSS